MAEAKKVARPSFVVCAGSHIREMRIQRCRSSDRVSLDTSVTLTRSSTAICLGRPFRYRRARFSAWLRQEMML